MKKSATIRETINPPINPDKKLEIIILYHAPFKYNLKGFSFVSVY